MSPSADLVLGEFVRTIDDRFRVSLPPELTAQLFGTEASGMLAKERSGCISLWTAANWASQIDPGMEVVSSKIRAGKLAGRWHEVQRLGRMLSTRHRPVQLAGRARLLLPESFRSFLGVEPNGEVMIVGAGVCLELWNPTAWNRYVEEQIPDFRQTFDQLAS